MHDPPESFHLDSRVLSPKLRDLAEEMQKRSKEAGYASRFFDLHERLTDEWANRIYTAYRETWEQQNRSVTPAFIRWIHGRAIVRTINARGSSVLSEVQRRATARGQQLREAEINAWNGMMGPLATKWRDKLEAEATALEYRTAKYRQASVRALPERKGESLAAKPANRQGASARRQLRPIDERKELIARLKARSLNAAARKICELIDKTIDKAAPIRQGNLAPLKSWQEQAPNQRSWEGFYDHPKTRNRVRAYVNKVPPLRTATKSSK